MKTIIEQLTQAGFTDIKTNELGADILCVNLAGETVGLTMCPAYRYTANELISMKCKNLSMYNKWYCICRYNDFERVKEAIGTEFCIVGKTALYKFCLKNIYGEESEETR